jgi:hypothetical protein
MAKRWERGAWVSNGKPEDSINIIIIPSTVMVMKMLVQIIRPGERRVLLVTEGTRCDTEVVLQQGALKCCEQPVRRLMMAQVPVGRRKTTSKLARAGPFSVPALCVC